MTLETFLMLLLTVSIFDSLFTEAVKQVFEISNKKFPSSNILAGIIAVFLAILTYTAYLITNDLVLNMQHIVRLISLLLLSWLTAMVGYDKVVQALLQVQNKTKED